MRLPQSVCETLRTRIQAVLLIRYTCKSAIVPSWPGFVDERRDPAITLLPAEVNKVTVDSLFRTSYQYSLNESRDVAVQQRGG